MIFIVIKLTKNVQLEALIAIKIYENICAWIWTYLLRYPPIYKLEGHVK